MNIFFNKFKLNGEKEEFPTIIGTIENGVVFRGTKVRLHVDGIKVVYQ